MAAQRSRRWQLTLLDASGGSSLSCTIVWGRRDAIGQGSGLKGALVLSHSQPAEPTMRNSQMGARACFLQGHHGNRVERASASEPEVHLVRRSPNPETGERSLARAGHAVGFLRGRATMALLPLRPYGTNRVTHVQYCGSDLLRCQSSSTAQATASADVAHPEIRQPPRGCPADKCCYLAALRGRMASAGVPKTLPRHLLEPTHPQGRCVPASNDATQPPQRTIRLASHLKRWQSCNV